MDTDSTEHVLAGPESELLFSDAMAAIKANRMDDAKDMLLRVVQMNPQHEQAWFWLAGVVTEVSQTIVCIQHVLALNPENSVAKEWLAVSVQAENEARATATESQVAELDRPVPPVGYYLRSHGFVSEEQLNSALMAQAEERRSGRARRIGELLVERGAISTTQLDMALHDQEQDFFSLFWD